MKAMLIVLMSLLFTFCSNAYSEQINNFETIEEAADYLYKLYYKEPEKIVKDFSPLVVDFDKKAKLNFTRMAIFEIAGQKRIKDSYENSNLYALKFLIASAENSHNSFGFNYKDIYHSFRYLMKYYVPDFIEEPCVAVDSKIFHNQDKHIDFSNIYNTRVVLCEYEDLPFILFQD